LEPGDCTTALTGDLPTDHEYYFFAHGSAGTIWSGELDGRFCVDPKDKFDYTDKTCDKSDQRWFRQTMHGRKNYKETFLPKGQMEW
jgi:hypothetical protein